MRTGDVIVRVGGDRVHEPDDVAAAIQDMRPGERVEVEVRRGGDSRTVGVELGNRAGQTP